ncbi:MAG: putative phosphate transport protein (TIGR00153 family) [Zhongshania marina]|uniref:TIGR00153 family protein n=1 Tax=Zhongshania marina TaxID=2304603 RepID=A0A2S4HLH0_9GAMM|nr:TIGR00153 family protein [Marortus luteolus]POP54541.1 TIGR00153 family protein [Marortus luteolus]RNL57993.1 TIGR00153 family protein [Zhongshania marina]
MPLNSLGNLFGKSPFAPIQEHMKQAKNCAEALKPFISAAMEGDWEKASEAHSVIVDLENEADKLKKQVRLQLPSNLFLPVPRADLLDLVSMQDRIANCSKDIAGLMLGRQMKIPEQLIKTMGEYVDLAIATSAQAMKAIEELDELLETGFRGREVKLVETLIEELDRLEHSADKVQITIRAELYLIEKELPPVDVMFLYQTINLIGELSDKSQKVGSRLQIIIAR